MGEKALTMRVDVMLCRVPARPSGAPSLLLLSSCSVLSVHALSILLLGLGSCVGPFLHCVPTALKAHKAPQTGAAS